MNVATINTNAITLHILRSRVLRALRVADEHGIPANVALLAERHALNLGLKPVRIGDGFSAYTCIRAEGTDYFVTILDNPWERREGQASCVSPIRND